MKKPAIKITTIVIGAVILLFAIYYVTTWIQASQDDSALGVRYDTLEISRHELYLKEGLQYDLRLEPADLSSVLREYSADNLRKELKGKAKWDSSDHAIATVDEDGVVTGCRPGEASICVSLGEKEYTCKVNVMPMEEDNEIPIRYKNDIFTQELYAQIEKMYVVPAAGSEAVHAVDKYTRSFIYAMLAEWELVSSEEIPSDDMLTGPGGVILDLKDGRSVEIIAVGGTKIRYEGREYQYRYGKDAYCGSACDFSEELTAFAARMRKGKSGEADSADQTDGVLDMKFDEMELSRKSICLQKGLPYKLRLEADRIRNAREYSEQNYQEVMLHWTKWKTSDKDVVTVDEYGQVRAVGAGTAVVTAEINGRTFPCHVQVLSDGGDGEAPIKYKNDLFTQELYDKVKKIEVIPGGGIHAKPKQYKVTDPFRISFIYAMLAGCGQTEQKKSTQHESQSSKGEMILYLKDGEKIHIVKSGRGSFDCKGKSYLYYYDKEADFGQGFDFFYDLTWSSTVFLQGVKKE